MTEVFLTVALTCCVQKSWYVFGLLLHALVSAVLVVIVTIVVRLDVLGRGGQFDRDLRLQNRRGWGGTAGLQLGQVLLDFPPGCLRGSFLSCAAHGLLVAALLFLLLFLRWNLHPRPLQSVADQLTPADRVHVYTLTVHPLVVVLLPPIKMDLQQSPNHLGDGADADQPGVHQIGALQLHSYLVVVLVVLLVAEQHHGSGLALVRLQILHPTELSGEASCGKKAGVEMETLSCWNSPGGFSLILFLSQNPGGNMKGEEP